VGTFAHEASSPPSEWRRQRQRVWSQYFPPDAASHGNRIYAVVFYVGADARSPRSLEQL
jgi:hypothetical protein